MTSWRCERCGLINGQGNQACRRCGSAGEANSYAQTSNQQPANQAPVYGLPHNYSTAPVQSGAWGNAGDQAATDRGVWRDGNLLVMDKNAKLPGRCLKCNTPSNGLTVNTTFRAVDAKMGWLRYIPYVRYIYWIARAASNNSAMVSLGVCQNHQSQAATLATVAKVLRIAGLLVLIYGLYSGNILWLLGLIMTVFGAGLAGANSVVKLSEMDDYFIWLAGVHPSYLSALPPIPR